MNRQAQGMPFTFDEPFFRVRADEVVGNVASGFDIPTMVGAALAQGHRMIAEPDEQVIA